MRTTQTKATRKSIVSSNAYARHLHHMYSSLSRDGLLAWFDPEEISKLEALMDRISGLESPRKEIEFVNGCLKIGAASRQVRFAA